jgi:hypothetical protein
MSEDVRLSDVELVRMAARYFSGHTRERFRALAARMEAEERAMAEILRGYEETEKLYARTYNPAEGPE